MNDNVTVFMALVLLFAISVPAILLGLLVAPWFFFILFLLIVIPLLFLIRRDHDTGG